jgi:hypothetical protein
MRKSIFTAMQAATLARWLTWATPALAQGLDWQTIQQFRQVATQCEHQGKWMQIHWMKNMEQAKASARAENKPILVFLVIGFHGEKNAGDC